MTAGGNGINLGDLTAGVGFRLNETQLLTSLRRVETRAQIQAVVKLTGDTRPALAELRAVEAKVQASRATMRVTLDTRAVTSELTRLNGRTVNISVKLSGIATVQNDVAALRTLLAGLGTNMQYRVTVNTSALSALNSQIATQIAQLTALIAQLRSLGGSGGPRPPPSPGPGGGGSGGLSPAVQNTLREVERLNNLWERGGINARNYEQALGAMQARLQTAAQGAARGTAEFARIDAGITRITQSLRSINVDSLQKLRTDAAAMRLAFDQATAGVQRNSAEFRTAAAAYASASASITARLTALAQSGTLTTQQLGQANRELQRLARESNTIAGNINHAGLSGSVVNSFGALGGQFGMVVTQGVAMIAMFKGITASAGPAAAALAGVAAATLVVGGALVGLGASGLKEVEKLQKGLNILEANGIADLDSIQAGVTRLKANLGTVGDAFSQGDLTLAMADIVKAGVSADDALTLMAASTRLAAAEQIGLNDASTLLLKNIRQYQGDVTQAAKVGDMLATAGNLAAGTANDLSVGLGIVAGTGFQAKIEMYNLLGMLVELDNKGMSAADIGANGLRSALSSLSDISVKGQGILHGLAIATEDAAGKARPAGDIMIDLGTAMRSLGIVADKTTGELSGNGEALRTVSGIMDNRAAAAVINLTGQWKRYGNTVKDSEGSLEHYSITMQQGVAPALNRVNKAFAEAGGSFVKTFADPLASFLTNTLTPLLRDLGDLFDKLGAVKKVGDITLGLKISAGDDSTTRVLKLLSLPAQLGVGIAQGLNEENLRLALQRAGVLPATNNPLVAAQQLQDVKTNYDAYYKLIMDMDARLKAGAANPSGPLKDWQAVPGRQMPGGTLPQLDTTVSDLVGAIGMAGKRVLNEFGVSGKDYHHDGAVSANAVHNGIDFGAPRGTPIPAPFAGQITTRQDAKNGKVFEMVDALGNRLVGIHLDEFDQEIIRRLQEGGGKALILKGERIGTVGNTGTTAGKTPHLHLMGYVVGSKTPVDARTIAYSGITPSEAAASTTPPPGPAPVTLKALQTEYTKLTAAWKQGKIDVDVYKAAITDLRTKADELAHTQATGSKEWEKTNAFIIKASNAINRNAASVKDATLTWAQWTKYREAAQALARREADLEDGRLSEKQVIQTKQDVATFQKDPVRALALQEAERQLALQKRVGDQKKTDDKQAEVERARVAQEQAQHEQQAAQLQKTLDQQLATGQLNLAQATAGKMAQNRDAQLALYKDDAAKRLKIEQGLGQDALASQKRVLEAVRDQAIQSAHEQADVQRAALTTQYGEGKEPAKLLKKIGQTETGLVASANATFDTEDSKLYLAQTERINTAQAAVTQETHKAAEKLRTLRGEYSSLAQGMRDKIAAGKVENADLDEYTRKLGEVNKKAADLGLTQSDFIVGARANAEALYQLGINAQLAAGYFDQFKTGLDLREAASQIPSADKTFAALTERITRMKGALSDPVVVETWSQSIKDMGAAGRLTGDQVKYLLATIQDLAAAPDFAWMRDFELATEVVSKRYGDGTAAMDAAMRQSYGLGQKGLDAALKGYGVQTLEELDGINKAAADSMRRTYKDVLDQMVVDAENAGQDMADAFEVATNRYGNGTGAADAAIRQSFGFGREGLDQALAHFNVTSLEQLDQVNRPIADSIRRVYKDVLDGMEQDMRDAVTRGQAILDNFIAEAERIADDTATAADLALGDREAQDSALVQRTAQRGPAMLLSFLGGAGNTFFGDKYWTKLGEQGRAEFTEALNKVMPEDFSHVPLALLRSMRDKIGASPEWQDLKTRLDEGISAALSRGSTDTGYADLGAVLEQAGALDSSAEGYASTLRDRLLPELIRIRDAAINPELKKSAEGAIAALNGEVDAARELADLQVELKLRALDRARASGGIGELDYIDQRQAILTQQETDRYLLDSQDKTGRALELAQTQHQARMTEITQAGKDARRALQERPVNDLANRANDLDRQQQTGAIDSVAYAQQLRELAAQADAYARAAERVGKTDLARDFRKVAAAAREAAGLIGKLQDVAEIAGYVQEGAQAFASLASALGQSEQAYDAFTGEKLETPWTDLAANLSGVANAAGKLVGLLGDVAAVAANPADIGAWVKLVTNVVSSVAEAIAGFKKAQAEVQQLKDQFVQDNPLLNPEDYQKAFTRSRGFFADVFGGGPEVVNQIDRIGLSFAKTMQGAFADGIKNGLSEAIKKNDVSLFSKTLKVAVGDAVVSGLVESFIQIELIKNILAPAIKAWSDALKTTDPDDDIAAAAGLDAAVTMVDEQATAFGTQVLPKLEFLREKGYFGDTGGSTGAGGSMFGAAPDLQLGLGRIEVQFPADSLRGLDDLRDQVVPIMVSSFSDFRLMVGEFRQIMASSSSRGAPPLSGLGGY